MSNSVFDIFKIGIGPSSSHTMGPMVAAGRFLAEIAGGNWPRPRTARVEAIRVSLHGSLAYTGLGHGTDRAVILGLCGIVPETADPDAFEAILARAKSSGEVSPPGHPAYRFQPARDLVFDRTERLPGHTNGMRFSALDGDGGLLLRRTYYSIGGGFVIGEAEATGIAKGASQPAVPYPFGTAAQMLEMAKASGRSIAAMMRANELVTATGPALDAGLDRIWVAMDACIERGLQQEGTLPGGFKVRRRAGSIAARLRDGWESNRQGLLGAGDWLTTYAMAVNEENAAGGRVVTAPTNGAAGVIPSVLRYALEFGTATRADMRDMLLTAAAIGSIIKRNASISGAEVGCQGEVGSASAMAAAALCAQLGGAPRQVENAAEMALEHHLGMTCDPVGGLVQVPCIERNAFGAVKAVTAALLALKGDGHHAVSLDACIETMRQTGRDMSERYKETSLAGLAVNVPSC
jgi:L-serine dehydratase